MYTSTLYILIDIKRCGMNYKLLYLNLLHNTLNNVKYREMKPGNYLFDRRCSSKSKTLVILNNKHVKLRNLSCRSTLIVK